MAKYKLKSDEPQIMKDIDMVFSDNVKTTATVIKKLAYKDPLFKDKNSVRDLITRNEAELRGRLSGMMSLRNDIDRVQHSKLYKRLLIRMEKNINNIRRDLLMK